MIDPLMAVLEYLRHDADLVALCEDRIATKHRFGAAALPWPSPSTGLQIRYSAGVPDLCVEVQRLRLEVRCYGDSQFEAAQVWRRLVSLSRETSREAVETSEGTALIHYLNMDSGPSLLHDPDIDMDFVLVFIEVSVAEEAVA